VWIFASGCLALEEGSQAAVLPGGVSSVLSGCGISNKLEFYDVNLSWPGLVWPSGVCSLFVWFPVHQDVWFTFALPELCSR
jgi:hypothetical protein